MSDWKNKLFFGDNLRILREHVRDETVRSQQTRVPGAGFSNIPLLDETDGRGTALDEE